MLTRIKKYSFGIWQIKPTLNTFQLQSVFVPALQVIDETFLNPFSYMFKKAGKFLSSGGFQILSFLVVASILISHSRNTV